MSAATIIFPHHLFEDHPAVTSGRPIFLVEETLFFNQYQFHKQKLAFHRATMKFYRDYLSSHGYTVEYIEAGDSDADIRTLISALADRQIESIHYCDPTDDWLRQRIEQPAEKHEMNSQEYKSPLFLNSRQDIADYFKDQERYHQTDFYIDQRKKRDILIAEDGKPVGGKWSFDADNRSKYPKNKKAPRLPFPEITDYHREAGRYVEEQFGDNYGEVSDYLHYPVTFEQSRQWLANFLEQRFQSFGTYQDAIVQDEPFLHHSLLTPMLNTGLLTPRRVVDDTLEYAEGRDIPLNSLEGFIRQVLGWREYMRAIYELEGRRERSQNFWGFDRSIPPSFWDASTGIPPVDTVIRRVLQTGYCHHIERLMVLGNFMLLCEFDPDEVYRWFMELFIDAYDWVMVPNVYGMSQFADGGLMATKPYISSSNYIRKMSDFDGGDWEAVWDGLFWRFMHEHRSYFEQNRRMKMLISTMDRMNDDTLESHLAHANAFLEEL